MFGKCKVCPEKDSRISDLQSRVEFLQSLLHPKVSNEIVPLEEIEANLVLDGQNDLVSLSEPDFAVQREADRLFSGNYDEMVDG